MKNHIATLLLLILGCLSTLLYAQESNNIIGTTNIISDTTNIAHVIPDTGYIMPDIIKQLGDTPTINIQQPLGQRIFENKYFQMTYIGVPLVIAGIATQGYPSDRFKELRDTYTPYFQHSYDNYLLFSPIAATVIMKLCGVESRSTWERFIVSGLFSATITAASTYAIKYSIETLRPDGSTHDSFPSGHTAIAFASAHILHKEYGELSPWISIGGYTVATTVGLTRILNDRHWVSDVLAGAGIGILSTELGYFFTELIYKDNKLNYIAHPDFTLPVTPSNVGLTMGLSLPLSSLDMGDGIHLTVSTGSRMGVEGAWYINPYIGIGGTAGVATMRTQLSNHTDDSFSIDAATLAAGAYGSLPLGYNSRFRANIKALIGCNFMAHKSLIPETMVADKCGLYYELGLSLSVAAKRHFGANIFCDYGGHCITATHTPSYKYNLTRTGHHNYLLHTATLGVTTSILF